MKVGAVVAGHLCLDIGCQVGSGRVTLAPGRLLELTDTTFSTGGAVANTGLALSKLGVTTRLIGKVGDDAFGVAVRALLAAHAPEGAKSIVIGSDNTSYTLVLTPPDGERMFLHDAGANDSFRADDVDLASVRGARLFHFGYPPLMRHMYQNDGCDLTRLFGRVKETGVVTSLDLSMPDPTSAAGRADWRTILTRTLPFVDLFLPSLEETLFMLRPAVFADRQNAQTPPPLTPRVREVAGELAGELLMMGVKVAGIKLGEHGLYLRTGSILPDGCPPGWAGRELWSPCLTADVKSTVGAGDTTIAGFLAGYLRGLTLEDTLTMACAVGACSVEGADAVSHVQSWETTKARLAHGWPRQPVNPGGDWHHDDTTGLWHGPADQP